MKKQLIEVLTEIINLLTECGWGDKAEWFEKTKQTLLSTPEDSKAIAETLRMLNAATSGIGSFTDLPLRPNSTGMSVGEARSLQWRLADELGELIEHLLTKNQEP